MVADGSRFSERRCSFSLRQVSHSPVGPGVPPHAHLRCKRVLRVGVKPGGAPEILGLIWSVAFIALARQKRRERLGHPWLRVSRFQSFETIRR